MPLLVLSGQHRTSTADLPVFLLLSLPSLSEIPRVQRRAITPPLADFEVKYPRKEAMAHSYLSGQYTMAAIAKHFGVHYSTVSRAVKEQEKTNK